MTKGLCEGCGRMTTVSNKYIERCESDKIKLITKDMYFCSNQCRIRWRNSVIDFLNIKKDEKYEQR